MSEHDGDAPNGDAIAPAFSGTPASNDVARRHRRRTFGIACCAFFLRFMALGAFWPYVSLWLNHGGHGAGTLGGLLALHRAVASISPPLVGGLADAYKRHREIFAVASLFNALAVAGMTLAPASVPWQAASLFVAATCDTSSLLDAMVVRCLAWAGATDLAPRSRAAGALAWVIVAPAYGSLEHSVGLEWLLRLYAVLVMLAVPVCVALPIRTAYTQLPRPPPKPSLSGTAAAADAPTSTGAAAADAATDAAAASGPSPAEVAKLSFARRVRIIARSPSTLVRLFLVGMTGLHFGIAFSYGFLFLTSELHATGLQLGLSLTCQALLEVPLFQVAAPLVRRLGMTTALMTCMLAASIRFVGYTTAGSPWGVLPYEVAHGWSFAITYTAIALLSEEYAPLGLQATVGGLGGSAQQLGSFTAALAWDAIRGACGLRTAFVVAACVFGVASLPLVVPCTLAARKRLHRRRRDAAPMLTRGAIRSDAHSTTTSTTSTELASPSGASAT